MKVVVDFDLCEANGLCMKAAPTVFELDDNDELHILTDTPEDALREKLQEAVRTCPRQAIRLVES